jgi:hypothetical protein
MNSGYLKRCGGVLILLAWLTLGAAHATTISSFVYGYINADVAGGGQVSQFLMDTTTSPVFLSGDSGHLFLDFATQDTRFRASYGSLGVYSNSWADNNVNTVYGANGAVHAGWFDTWMLTSPDMALGQQGHLALGLPVSGYAQAGRPEDANYYLQITVGPYAGTQVLAYNIQAAGTFFTLPMTFYWGEPITVDVQMQAHTYGAGDVRAIADFYDTVRCCSFQFVDGVGQPLNPDFSLATDSGHDYRTLGTDGVPEPNSLWLLGSVLGLAVVVLRKRRS